MHSIKTILLLGATGRTGREALHIALGRNYQVHTLVRNPDQLNCQSPQLKVFQGDTCCPKDMLAAMAGVDAVVSCLNISRKNDFPWAPLRTPEDFLSKTMKNLLQVSRDLDVGRLVFTSAWGVGDSRPAIPGWFAWFIDNSNLAAAYLEHERQEALVKGSHMQWTIVRPVGLTNSKKSKPIRIFFDNQGKPSLTVSRFDTARFLIDALESPDFIHQIAVVSH